MFIETRLDRSRIDHKTPRTLRLMVSLKAPEIKEEARQPIDVVLVLDISGSMTDPAAQGDRGSTKMTLAKQAARKFVEQLQASDRVGVVVYASNVAVLAPLKKLTDDHRGEIIEKLATLTAKGGTDMVAGTLRALALMGECQAASGRTRRVILFTDGLPTEGITAHAQVMQAITAQLDGKTPITAMGFGSVVVANGAGGGGYDPELLTSVARASGGTFYHAEGADGILSAFALELGALRSVAITEVKVILTPGAGIAVREVMNDFTVTSTGACTTIEVGNLYGGETQHLVMALTVPARENIFPRDTVAANIKMIGVEASGSTVVETQDVHFRYVKPAEADQKPDPVVEEQRLRLLAAKELELAFAEAAAGNHAAAAQRMDRIRRDSENLGTASSRVFARRLAVVIEDLGDVRLFRVKSAAIRGASSTLGKGRPSGTHYFDAETTTRAQARAVRDMGAKEQPPADAAPKNDEPPTANPAKRRVRNW